MLGLDNLQRHRVMMVLDDVVNLFPYRNLSWWWWYFEAAQAFAFKSAKKAKRLQSRTAEKEQRRLHVPLVDRTSGEPAPFIIVVQGPPQVLFVFANSWSPWAHLIFMACRLIDWSPCYLVPATEDSMKCRWNLEMHLVNCKIGLDPLCLLMLVTVNEWMQVGKTLLIQSLVKHYTKHNLSDVRGPITVVAGILWIPSNICRTNQHWNWRDVLESWIKEESWSGWTTLLRCTSLCMSCVWCHLWVVLTTSSWDGLCNETICGERETERQRDRQTDRDRETERQTETERQRETGRQREMNADWQLDRWVCWFLFQANRGGSSLWSVQMISMQWLMQPNLQIWFCYSLMAALALRWWASATRTTSNIWFVAWIFACTL